MITKLKILLGMLFFISGIAVAQVGINITAPDPSSELDNTSTSKGLLIPRMDTTGRNGITNPATRLLIFNTTLNDVEYNAGTPSVPKWISATMASNDLNTTSGTTQLGGDLTKATTISALSATNKLTFTGTGVDMFNLDSNTLSVDGTNNRIGIGTAAPTKTLDVNGEINATSNITTSGNMSATGTVSSTGDVSTSNLFRGTYGMYFQRAGGQTISLRDGTWAGANITYSTNNLSISQNDNYGQMNFSLGGVAGPRNFTFSGGNMGIGTTTPSVKLDVAGAIKVSSENITTPAAGMIRFNDATNSFEGYNGSTWITF